MLRNPDYITARRLLLERVHATDTEELPLSECCGHVIACDLRATENVPPFDRSPYDGYAFQSGDTKGASKQSPVTLRLLEEVAAGAVPTKAVTSGAATKILTGAPIPAGADCVCKYEDTEFSDKAVTLFRSYGHGESIVTVGEDVRAGDLLARCGSKIDAGLAGTLAAQGITRPLVFRSPRIGLISTGDEVVEADEPLAEGKIRNSNRHLLEAALIREGMSPVYLGICGDSVNAISALIEKGLAECDAVISSGGVSVGDYDLTPAAMERLGVKLLFRGVDMKPGMACAYGTKNGKPVCGLSGNPAAAITNFYAVALPALKKLAGRHDFISNEIKLTLKDGFKKKSPLTRLLRGTLDLSDGAAKMLLTQDQGNVVLSSMIGCNVMAVVPAGSGALPAGAELKGFLI